MNDDRDPGEQQVRGDEERAQREVCDPDVPSYFTRLAAIDVGKHIEKKGKFSYLSWAWAVDQLLRADVRANWAYGEPVMFGETMMVTCTVTAFGIPRKMQLPVMDGQNRPIKNPDAFAVNTAMQRCLVKAIALHGIGLYIYAGEDVPHQEETAPEQLSPRLLNVLQELRDTSLNGMDALKVAWRALASADRDRLRDELDALKEAATKADEGGRDGAV